jgi:hypothetical protein
MAVAATFWALVAQRNGGEVKVSFLSSTNELGIDWVVFKLKNETNRRLHGRFEVHLHGHAGWNPIADKKRHGVSSSYDLNPGESADVDVRWHEEMLRWRLHTSGVLQPTRWESWRYRLSSKLGTRSTTWAGILEPSLRKLTAEGPVMQMKDPAQ